MARISDHTNLDQSTEVLSQRSVVYELNTARAQFVDAPFDQAIMEVCTSHSDVVVLSADLSKYTDILTLPTARPKQFIQIGMAEQNLLGVAGGLAKAGFIPIAVTFAVYAIRRAHDQFAMCMGSGPTPRGIVVGFTPGITNPARVHHQAIEDIATVRALPGTCIIDPADATEFRAALVAAVDHPGLVYLRGYRGRVAKLFDPEKFSFRIGETYVLHQGSGVGIIATGCATQWALEASAILQLREVEHSVLHVPTLKPCSISQIAAFCEGRKSVVTIENHSIIGGLGSLVAETLSERGIGTRLWRHGIPDRWAPGGSLDYIRRQLGLSGEDLAAAIEEVIA